MPVHTFISFAGSTSMCPTAWTRAAAEIRDTGDALIAFTEAKRDARAARQGQGGDRGEVQRTRPPRRCGVTDQPMDYRD